MKFIAAILFMVIAVDVSSKVSKLDSGGYMNIYCVNGYVVIVKGEGGVTQMYRPSPDGTNPPQPMTCNEYQLQEQLRKGGKSKTG